MVIPVVKIYLDFSDSKRPFQINERGPLSQLITSTEEHLKTNSSNTNDISLLIQRIRDNICVADQRPLLRQIRSQGALEGGNFNIVSSLELLHNLRQVSRYLTQKPFENFHLSIGFNGVEPSEVALRFDWSYHVREGRSVRGPVVDLFIEKVILAVFEQEQEYVVWEKGFGAISSVFVEKVLGQGQCGYQVDLKNSRHFYPEVVVWPEENKVERL